MTNTFAMTLPQINNLLALMTESKLHCQVESVYTTGGAGVLELKRRCQLSWYKVTTRQGIQNVNQTGQSTYEWNDEAGRWDVA